jgi:hypothetical protein
LNEIDNERNELKIIDETILKIRGQERVKTTKRSALNSEKIQQELIPIKNKIRMVQNEINQYQLEISDSEQFISTLEKRVKELQNSLLARKVLGELPLTHCPQCLSPLVSHVDDNHCQLCKQPLEEEAERANAKRLRQEMELQIKESKGLLQEKEKEVSQMMGELPSLVESGRVLQKQLDISIEVSQSTRDQRIDSLLVDKGGIERNIEYLTRQLKAVELLDLLKRKLLELASTIEKLRLEISQKENQQKRNFQTALEKIREYTLYLLKNDLDRQEEFKSGFSVDINFYKDSYSLDGGNNFSASSKTYFKNSVLFAMFFSSLELGFFRYPRFVLCDNMEDKGMEKIRTQNFQELIVSTSERLGSDHQIIFTTSMISDNLNSNQYCVGPEYSSSNKTLKF